METYLRLLFATFTLIVYACTIGGVYSFYDVITCRFTDNKWLWVIGGIIYTQTLVLLSIGFTYFTITEAYLK